MLQAVKKGEDGAAVSNRLLCLSRKLCCAGELAVSFFSQDITLSGQSVCEEIRVTFGQWHAYGGWITQARFINAALLKKKIIPVLLEVNSVDRSDWDDDYIKHNPQMNKNLVIRYFRWQRHQSFRRGLVFWIIVAYSSTKIHHLPSRERGNKD